MQLDLLHLVLCLGLFAALGWIVFDRLKRARHVAADGHALRQAETLAADLASERARREEAEKRLAVAEAQSEEAEKRFANMAHEAVRNAHQEFLRQANETFEHQKTRTRGDLEKLMTPIGETFAEFKKRVDELEKARTSDKSAIFEQVRQMGEQLRETRESTGKLAAALSAPRGGGRWGEESLRNVLELSGLSPYADFVEQDHSSNGGEASKRPDVVIRMPNEREVVIDAKVTVDDFLKAADATDQAERNLHLKNHARKMRAHVKQLSGKAYWEAIETRVDFVAMYVPGENFYAAALQEDHDLFDYAARNKVLIVTPSTLIALAKAVAYGWRQEEAARNAREAARLGQDLYKSLATMGEHIDRLGKSVGATARHFNSMVGSLEKSVLPKARRFEELQIAERGGKVLPHLDPVDETTRTATVEELVYERPVGDRSED